MVQVSFTMVVGGGARRQTYTVGFDDAHLMTVNPEVECGERRGINDSEPIGAAWNER